MPLKPFFIKLARWLNDQFTENEISYNSLFTELTYNKNEKNDATKFDLDIWSWTSQLSEKNIYGKLETLVYLVYDAVVENCLAYR